MKASLGEDINTHDLGGPNVSVLSGGARFIQIADPYHLPIVNLCDNPGVMAGSEAERSGILRHGGRMFAAQVGTHTPGSMSRCARPTGSAAASWACSASTGRPRATRSPARRWARRPPPVRPGPPTRTRTPTALLRQAELESSDRSVSGFGFDDLIDPRTLRNVLLDAALDIALARRDAAPAPVQRVGYLP